MKFLLVTLSFALLAFAVAEPFLIQTAPGQNQRCPDFCTRLYNPVCAKSFRCTALFGNPCKLDAWNCKTARQEELFYPAGNFDCRFLDRFNSIICRTN